MVISTPNIQIISITSHLKLALLDLREFAVFAGLTSKRETEKQGALYIVRNVLENQELNILYNEHGRPHLSDNETCISISHAHEKLAVLFSHNGVNVGIDIETVREKVLKIKERFLSPSELERLEGASTEEYTLYWAIKEAVYKAAHIAGLIFSEQILVDPFTYSEKGGEISVDIKHETIEKKFILQYRKIEDYVLVYTNNA